MKLFQQSKQQKMSQQKKEYADKIYNIKGLSWMLKSVSGTSSVCSTNSSHIDQQFKIFKLKDEKKKWKKKINKKFQSVGYQIEAKIKTKYNKKQSFDINYKKQPDLKYMPHLREIKSIYEKNLRINDEQEENKQRLKRFSLDNLKDMSNQQENQVEFKRNKVLVERDESNISIIDMDKNGMQIFCLKKKLIDTKNQNKKVQKSRNLLKIHGKQKEFMNKQNQDFFKKCSEWIVKKTQFYKQFDICEYERKLIQQKCREKQ